MNWTQPGWLRVTFVILLFSVTSLAIALGILLHRSTAARENTLIDSAHYQAVFLTSGQVYFGKVKDITKNYVDLRSIYYLNSAQATDSKATASSTNFQLVKLGCELHGPSDQMIINRDQVTFWENLNNSSQVVTSINKWMSANPNGQTCPNVSSSSTQQSSTDSSQATQSTTNTKK